MFPDVCMYVYVYVCMYRHKHTHIGITKQKMYVYWNWPDHVCMQTILGLIPGTSRLVWERPLFETPYRAIPNQWRKHAKLERQCSAFVRRLRSTLQKVNFVVEFRHITLPYFTNDAEGTLNPRCFFPLLGPQHPGIPNVFEPLSLQRVPLIYPSSAYISQLLHAELINQSVLPIISTLPWELPEVCDQQAAPLLSFMKQEQSETRTKILLLIVGENKQMHKSLGFKTAGRVSEHFATHHCWLAVGILWG